MCVDEVAAEKFALYIAQRVQQQINQAICPEHFSGEEWAQQQRLVDEAIALMLSLERGGVVTLPSTLPLGYTPKSLALD